MRIQIIESSNIMYDPAHYRWFKETIASSVSLHSRERLDWLNAETIDYGCDVFLIPISATQVQIGFATDSQKLNTDHSLHWVTIEVLGITTYDALTQVLLATIGTAFFQSAMGHFMTDWADVKTALNLGSKAYCFEFDWNAAQQATQLFEATKRNSQLPLEIVSCAMLLNQGLSLNQTFENAQRLMSDNFISVDCLTITNVTNTYKIPQKNMLMCVCKTTNLDTI